MWTIRDAAAAYDSPVEDWGYAYNYGPIIESLGTVVVQVDDEDYQGDTRVLLRRGDEEWGHVIIGWGSCSGCDALQACSSWSEVRDLREQIANSVRWFASTREAMDWFTHHDWGLDHAWHADETKKYLSQAATALLGAWEGDKA